MAAFIAALPRSPVDGMPAAAARSSLIICVTSRSANASSLSCASSFRPSTSTRSTCICSYCVAMRTVSASPTCSASFLRRCTVSSSRRSTSRRRRDFSSASRRSCRPTFACTSVSRMRETISRRSSGGVERDSRSSSDFRKLSNTTRWPLWRGGLRIVKRAGFSQCDHMSTSALVAVTATTEIIRGAPRVRVNVAYTEALTKVGLVPVVIPPLAASNASAILDGVRGLLVTGGEDIAPALYHEQPHPTVEAHEGRDESEIALILEARRRGMPTLAICRGIQVVNVAFGGSLVQDIPSQCPTAIDHDPEGNRADRVHEVRVDADSRLAAALR